jgi:serine/threonine protein kinase
MTSAVPASPAPPAPGDCAICKKPRTGSRCDQCGAAAAPGGLKVVRLISQSPRGRLYLAEDETGQQIALKELVFASVPSIAHIEGFEREASMLEQLKHPQIPRFVRHFREGEGIHLRLYLAQEFVPGQSLLERVGSHRFNEKEVKEIARQILGVLEYLQSLSPRVLHRDIKPANIMRRPKGQLVLVDFDCARDVPRGLTYGSTLVGTFGYMPPEQLGGTVDVTSDLYALGASLIHLLSRKPPSELMAPGMRLAFEDKVSVNHHFKKWLAKMVEVDPKARFPNATEALAALDEPQKLAPPPVPVKKLPPKPAPVKPRPSTGVHQPVGVGTTLVIAIPFILIAVGVGYAMASVEKKPTPVRPAPVAPPAPAQRTGTSLPEGQFQRLAHRLTDHNLEVRVFGAMVSPNENSPQIPNMNSSQRWILVDLEVKSSESMPVPARWWDWVSLQSGVNCRENCVVVQPHSVRYGRTEGNVSRQGAVVKGVTFPPDTVLPHETRQLDVFFLVSEKAFPLTLELLDGTKLPLKLKADP